MEVPRFRVLRVLGSGAASVVALALDRADASMDPVALKVVRQRDPQACARVETEARILAALHDPNVVRVHRLLEKDRRAVLVMEHVDGATAADLARRWGCLPPEVAVAIALRAAAALLRVWEVPGPGGVPLRIVHRDLTPANLLVSVAGEVKLVDFGGATSEITAPPPPSGTPGFAAPEARSGPGDGRKLDVYGLGATLYSMVTGKVLVPPSAPARHERTIARALLHLDPPGVSRSARAMLRALIGAACRFDPDRRPTLPEALGRLEAVAASLRPPDLGAFGAGRVEPLVQGRAEAEAHPSWPDLAFLEAPGEVADRRLPLAGPGRGLALRPAPPRPEEEPLLARLARPRWWSFWRAADPAEIVATLGALRGTRDPRAVSRANELTEHPDPRVAEAAWDLLVGACEPP